MLKFFRKARQNFLSRKNITMYALYAIGEILLVMIGILLAIQVNNWNNAKIEKRVGKQFYENFKRQITEDLEIIENTIVYNNDYKEQFDYATKIIEANDRSKIDTLGKIAINLSKYSDFDRTSNIYQSLANSGEVKLIKNPKIIEAIQILEESYTYFNRMEKIHYDLVTSIVPELITIIKYSNQKVVFPDRLYNYFFQNIFITSSGVMQEKDDVYKRTKGQIIQLIEMIEEELGIDK